VTFGRSPRTVGPEGAGQVSDPLYRHFPADRTPPILQSSAPATYRRVKIARRFEMTRLMLALPLIAALTGCATTEGFVQDVEDVTNAVIR
jgi:predicted small secreted protein